MARWYPIPRPKSVLWIEAIPAHKNDLKSRSGGTESDGSFVIEAIEPGDYVIARDGKSIAPPCMRGRTDNHKATVSAVLRFRSSTN